MPRVKKNVLKNIHWAIDPRNILKHHQEWSRRLDDVDTSFESVNSWDSLGFDKGCSSGRGQTGERNSTGLFALDIYFGIAV